VTQTLLVPSLFVPSLGDDFSPEGFMLQQLFGFAMLLVACLAVFLALRIGLSIGRDDQNRRES
ncbi:MAG: hypothetical protein WCB52_03010, partial [Pseudolabrys sp.]